MTTHSVETRWIDGMAFENSIDGFTVPVDAAEEFGGKDRGPKPKLLLLAALTGCTGMDVVSILGKMKQQPSFFNLKVEGDLSDEHPKTYRTIRLIYQFKASDNLDDTKVRKAVGLSQDQYCGVSAMLRESSQLEWSVEYLED